MAGSSNFGSRGRRRMKVTRGTSPVAEGGVAMPPAADSVHAATAFERFEFIYSDLAADLVCYSAAPGGGIETDVCVDSAVTVPSGTALRLYYPAKPCGGWLYMLGLRMSETTRLETLWVPVVDLKGGESTGTEGRGRSTLHADDRVHSFRL